jgi:UDP-galactopyranose mutase
MNTFHEVWGVTRPEEARSKIQSQQPLLKREPENLEEQSLSMVGTDIYNMFIKEYTQKQWQRHPKDLPAWIIKRLPLRFTYDNNYYDDRYQGIPIGGYTQIIEKMIAGAEVWTSTDYFANRKYFDQLGQVMVFTGKIDEYFDYEYGELEYRTLRFDHEFLNMENYQGVAIINYPQLDYPYTRIIEHKHFQETPKDQFTIVTKEHPDTWDRSKVPYYPINNPDNQRIFKRYQERSQTLSNVIFGGRLAEYRYYDMHMVIRSAWSKYDSLKTQNI